MRRAGSAVLLGALAVAGIAAGIFVSSGGASSKAFRATSHVSVSATDFKCTLSTPSVLAGTVIFTVSNKGKTSHGFKIAGKKTPLILPGHTARLRVAFTRHGRYPYLCTGPGLASARMKGIFSVVAPTPTPTATTPSATTATTTTATTVGTANTTVTVEMFDEGPPRFALSQSTMPSGLVTFMIKNKCVSFCSFNLEGVKAGTLLNPGESETWTVGLPAGHYLFHCDAAPQLMNGSLTVTP